MDRRRPERGLSAEERALWQRLTGAVRPLAKREAAKRGAVLPAAQPEARSGVEPKAKARARKPSPVPLVPKAVPPPPAPGSGVARSQAERLKRGKLPIDATLDLHGHRQAEAHQELSTFLADSQARGQRCVLIVTGHGLGKEEGGVLRRMVPRWLEQSPNRARVLAVEQAQPKHGGAGALYVLLRRKRA